MPKKIVTPTEAPAERIKALFEQYKRKANEIEQCEERLEGLEIWNSKNRPQLGTLSESKAEQLLHDIKANENTIEILKLRIPGQEQLLTVIRTDMADCLFEASVQYAELVQCELREIETKIEAVLIPFFGGDARNHTRATLSMRHLIRVCKTFEDPRGWLNQNTEVATLVSMAQQIAEGFERHERTGSVLPDEIQKPLRAAALTN